VGQTPVFYEGENPYNNSGDKSGGPDKELKAAEAIRKGVGVIIFSSWLPI
jgi:hypothetical protein